MNSQSKRLLGKCESHKLNTIKCDADCGKHLEGHHHCLRRDLYNTIFFLYIYSK